MLRIEEVMLNTRNNEALWVLYLLSNLMHRNFHTSPQEFPQNHALCTHSLDLSLEV